MNCTLGRALLALCLAPACGPSPPADSAAATEPTEPSDASTTTPTTTMPSPDMGTDDPICPTLPPLVIPDCVPTTACPETTVHTGDITITTAEDIAALTCVHELRGRLDVFDEKIQTLAGLERLTRVRGSIWISTASNLADLDGLCGLTTIEARTDGTGGDLDIAFNFKLTGLAGLARLEQVAGDLTIRDNSALVSLRGLASLTSVGGDLEVWDNPALESLHGLESLGPGIALLIWDNDVLLDLCGLHRLTVVDSLAVLGNDALRTLWGAHNIERAIVEVDIAGNNELVDLTGLQELSDVPHLKVRGNSALHSLAGLDALTTLETLSIYENDGLTDWQPPPTLLAVHHLDLCANENLTSLSATNLAVDRLTVIYNDLLGDPAGESYAASLDISAPKVARNSPPPFPDLSPCPWVGDGTCDEEDACLEHFCVLCNHDDCCGDLGPTAMCAPDTDAPTDCPGPH